MGRMPRFGKEIHGAFFWHYYPSQVRAFHDYSTRPSLGLVQELTPLLLADMRLRKPSNTSLICACPGRRGNDICRKASRYRSHAACPDRDPTLTSTVRGLHTSYRCDG